MSCHSRFHSHSIRMSIVFWFTGTNISIFCWYPLLITYSKRVNQKFDFAWCGVQEILYAVLYKRLQNVKITQKKYSIPTESLLYILVVSYILNILERINCFWILSTKTSSLVMISYLLSLKS